MESSRSSTDARKHPDENQIKHDDRRSQSRTDNVLAQIEEATYAILRKHEKKSA
jgi:hypothetical protein